MMIDYQLGIEIIVKAFLNTFLWEPGRKKWLGIFKKYSPVSADNIQVNISENNNLFVKFQHLSQTPVFGSDAFEYYKHLQEIYESHTVFANSKASLITDNLGITEVRSYLEPWKENNLTSDEYIKLRGGKYSEKIGRIEYLVSALKNDSSFHKDNLRSAIRQIEVQELETLMQ